MKLIGFLLLGFTVAQYPGACDAGDFVSSVAVDHLVRVPDEFFDLQGKTVRFTPAGAGAYRVQTFNGAQLLSGTKVLENGDAQGRWDCKGWKVDLPFQFPFGGKNWSSVWVNQDGNISFGDSESALWSQRDPWSDGGMVSVAAAIDSRSAAGMERMIAAFWGPYQNPTVGQISVRVEQRSLAVTWNVTRAAWGQAVLGVNTFQARLYASGTIELAYSHIAERDGIVGIFPGQPPIAKTIAHWDADGESVGANLDMAAADIYDCGTALDLAITMKAPALTRVDQESLNYECYVNHGGSNDLVQLSVTDQPRISCGLGPSPQKTGWRIHGNRVDLFISKLLVRGNPTCSFAFDVTWRGKYARINSSGWQLPADCLSNSGTVKFSALHEAHQGNLFEVFHYAVVPKSPDRLLKSIYRQVPPRDDIAIVFTDFRLDDLYGGGGGALASNFPILGIGDGAAHPRSTKDIGSTQLQMTIATSWLGSPTFEETGANDDGSRWINFARGVKWICHECTHRWGMNLSFVNPLTGQNEKLSDSVGHWRAELDTTAMYPVTDYFLQRQGVGGSIMGGSAWRDNSDGTFSQSDYPLTVPGGYSSLDRYIMGMLPAEQVPQTRVIEDLKDLGDNRFSGSPVRVRIDEIVAAMGQRKPGFADSQKTFHMSFYVAHEPGKEVDPAMMERARKLSIAVSNYFFRATGGVMRVIPPGQ